MSATPESKKMITDVFVEGGRKAGQLGQVVLFPIS